MRIVQEALTFDDVLLVPAYSEVLPRDVDLSTMLSRRIRLNLPLVSAAMDTVTEARLAIALAQEGGIGIIHKNMTALEQAREVGRVKKYESGVVKDPITIRPDATVRQVIELTRARGLGRDDVAADDLELRVGELDALDHLQHTARVAVRCVDHHHVHARLDQRRDAIERVGRRADGGAGAQATVLVLAGTREFLGLLEVLHRDHAAQLARGIRDQHLLDAVAVQQQQYFLARRVLAHRDQALARRHHRGDRRVELFLEADIAMGDDAHHLVGLVDHRQARDAARALVDAGADGVKVGIGPGSICTTRVVAGVGVPQITAVSNVAAALEGRGIPLIADGGVRYSGDVAKAIAAGAHSIMIGGLFGGTEESPGDVELYQGASYKSYRGMGSLGAMAQRHGSSDRYFQENVDELEKLVPEGVEGRVPYKGSLVAIVHQLAGGLRAAMGYTGSANIEQMRTRPHFVRITGAGVRESHVHDVAITKEAPNYRVS